MSYHLIRYELIAIAPTAQALSSVARHTELT
jgi:hypothetical protein